MTSHYTPLIKVYLIASVVHTNRRLFGVKSRRGLAADMLILYVLLLRFYYLESGISFAEQSEETCLELF